jgi:hypothetical protein
MAAVGAATSIAGGLSANRKAEKAAKLDAHLVALQRREEMRKLRRQADWDVAQARATIGASNLQMSGSARRYVTELRSEYSKQLSYAGAANTREQAAIKAGGRGAGDGLLVRGVGQAISAGILAASSRNTDEGPD